jgi:hypothetical protein
MANNDPSVDKPETSRTVLSQDPHAVREPKEKQS